MPNTTHDSRELLRDAANELLRAFDDNDVHPLTRAGRLDRAVALIRAALAEPVDKHIEA